MRYNILTPAPDFIGLGAQRSGTSWIYACLYEHPQVFIPVKEIHFYSRERNWSKGYDWYEGLFSKCPKNKKSGEFSTSYLCDPDAPSRIHQRYPNVKLIASLRNPVNRAFSNYTNDLLSGNISLDVSFAEAVKKRPEYFEQGCYAKHLSRYLKCFSPEQLLILIYEESLLDPRGFIQRIFEFIGVDKTFCPSMIHSKVNVGRVPKYLLLERLLNNLSSVFANGLLRQVWWRAKKMGWGDKIRALNLSKERQEQSQLTPEFRAHLMALYEDENRSLESLTGKSLKYWRC